MNDLMVKEMSILSGLDEGTILSFSEQLPDTDDSVFTKDGRDIHSVIGSETRYDMWVKRGIEANSLVEGLDFNLHTSDQVRLEGNREVKRKITDYYFRPQAASMMAMYGNSKRGAEVRRYFAAMEQAAVQMANKTIQHSQEDDWTSQLAGAMRPIIEEMIDVKIKQNNDRIAKALGSVVKKQFLPQPSLDPRGAVVSIVRNYANKNGIQESQAFFQLYGHFMTQTSYNPSIQAKKVGLRPIEYIEKKGDMDVLYRCAKEFLV